MKSQPALRPIVRVLSAQPLLVSAIAAALALAGGAGDVRAAVTSKARKAEPTEFEEVRLIIEFNSTDEDVGVQFFLDVDTWQSIRILNPSGKEIFDARARGDLLRQGGATEMFVEGNEPTLDERPLEEFFALFPEGTYEFRGRTPEGDALAGEFEFSHDIPAGPELITPQGTGDECAENVPLPAVIAWNEVTRDIEDRPIDIESYEVIIESDDVNFDVTIPADAGTSLTVPAEVLKPGTEYDFEVLAIAENGNQTISGNCFVTAD
jgi:hypothetical protein